MKTACYLAAACLLLASCSKDDVATVPDIGKEEGTVVPEGASSQLISLAVTSPETEVLTRGTGTVGGVTAEENVWAGQRINVFMFCKGTLIPAHLASDDNGNLLDSIYYDTQMYTPGSSITKTKGTTKGLASCINGDVKYYPMQGQSDFWGYYLDDAVTGKPVIDDNNLMVPFTIDGSQDILAGTTDRFSDYQSARDQSSVSINDLYSAKSATYDVQPNIVFKHQLTRLKFYARAENIRASNQADVIHVDSVAHLDRTDSLRYILLSDEEKKNFTLSTGVYVDTIKIYSAKTGRLIVAYDTTNDPDGSQRIVWDTKQDASGKEVADSAYFCLGMKKSETATQEDNLVPLSTFIPTYSEDKSVYNPLGEALLVSPKADHSYRIEIYMHQYVKSKEDWWVPTYGSQVYLDKNIKYPSIVKYITLPSKDSKGNALTDIKGYSFNINLTISGLEKISVSAQLSAWKSGESINQSIE